MNAKEFSQTINSLKENVDGIHDMLTDEETKFFDVLEAVEPLNVNEFDRLGVQLMDTWARMRELAADRRGIMETHVALKGAGLL